mgnify:CR=1 FL=1
MDSEVKKLILLPKIVRPLLRWDLPTLEVNLPSMMLFRRVEKSMDCLVAELEREPMRKLQKLRDNKV